MANLEDKFPIIGTPDLSVHLYGVISPYGTTDDLKILCSDLLALYNNLTAIVANKTIDALNNTLLNIANSAISASAGIQLSKLQTVLADRVIISGGTGVITVSPVTSTELSYLIGVTSSIQSQLNAKLSDGGDSPGSTLVAGTNNAQSFNLETNNIAALEIDTSQQVGIGVTPTTTFHVHSNLASTFPIITLENNSGNHQIFSGLGDPESTITGSVGDEYTNLTNGVKYVKYSGSVTNTGWNSQHIGAVCQYSNTDTVTDLNVVLEATVPIGGTVDVIDPGFTQSATHGIQCDFDGLVEVSWFLHLGSGGVDNCTRYRLTLNAVLTGYIAICNITNTGGVDRGNAVCPGQVISVSNGDVFFLTSRRLPGASNATATTMAGAGISFLKIKRIR